MHCFSQGKIPADGLTDIEIEKLLLEFSSQDMNNKKSVGIGEREGRVYSSLVGKRNYYFSHGIGRSGDISERQPKAKGSSDLYALTKKMTNHIVGISGVLNSKRATVLPVATGMGLFFVFSSLKSLCSFKKHVVWSRIDQKSCFKSMILADAVPIIVEQRYDSNNHLETDVDKIEEILQQQTDIIAVFTTTSCFAPRQPDNVIRVSELCKKYNVFHVINNAYGLQCSHICHNINQSLRIAPEKVIVVQSTDKNFMVPVGGSVIFSANEQLIKNLDNSYAGRASISPIIDLFVTFCSMGESNYKKLLKERKENFAYFKNKLMQNEIKIVPSPNNKISIAVTFENEQINMLHIGSQLFTRNVSGAKFNQKKDETKNICGYSFKNWGMNVDNLTETNYLSFACAIGTDKTAIDRFVKKLVSVTKKNSKKNSKKN